MAIEQLTDGNTSGSLVGRSDDKLGFYGLTTPITKPAISIIGTTTATTALNETAIARINAALRALGLVSTDG
jgi:hypothetical protein